MNVLNLLVSGNAGGIETLCNNIDKYDDINNYWLFLFSGGKIAEQMKNRNPEKVYILGYSKVSFFKYVKKIERICKKNKIDIINIHHASLYGDILYCYLKKRNKNIKFVRTLHSCFEPKYDLNKNKLTNKIMFYFKNKALQKSNLIIGVSNAVIKSYEKSFEINNKNKAVIYNGISDDFFNNSISRKITNNLNEIIYIGRLEEVKGIDLLINSIYRLKECKIHLTIVGNGTQKNFLEELVKKLKIENLVTFTGTQYNVIPWLDKADIFVYPSICNEAFGISVVEAMARRCIPITFNKGGLPEVIENNKSGIIVNRVNDKELAIAIQKVISMNSKEKDKIINFALEQSKKFTIKNTIINLKKEYLKIL